MTGVGGLEDDHNKNLRRLQIATLKTTHSESELRKYLASENVTIYQLQIEIGQFDQQYQYMEQIQNDILMELPQQEVEGMLNNNENNNRKLCEVRTKAGEYLECLIEKKGRNSK